eukprot:3749317-Heterocapsa_arctica.AAC.1
MASAINPIASSALASCILAHLSSSSAPKKLFMSGQAHHPPVNLAMVTIVVWSALLADFWTSALVVDQAVAASSL